MGKPQIRKMVIPSKMSELPHVHQAVLKEARESNYPEESLFAIKLALDEAVTNAIRHGNCSEPCRKVSIEYTVTPQEVRITVCDEGCGFMPTTLPDPTHNAHLNRPHGRGVMLMNAYMSQVTYNDAGNCVTLVKMRQCSRPHSR